MARSYTWNIAPEVPTAVEQAVQPTSIGQLDSGTLIGNGVQRPLRRDRKNDFAVASGSALIKSNIGQILGTRAATDFAPGELPDRPDFGSWLHLLRHRKNDAATQELARYYVVDALAKWEPRASVTTVKLEQSGRELRITVGFDVVDSAGNIVAESEMTTVSIGEGQ